MDYLILFLRIFYPIYHWIYVFAFIQFAYMNKFSIEFGCRIIAYFEFSFKCGWIAVLYANETKLSDINIKGTSV